MRAGIVALTGALDEDDTIHGVAVSARYRRATGRLRQRLNSRLIGDVRTGAAAELRQPGEIIGA